MKYKFKELLFFVILTFGISCLFTLIIIILHKDSGLLYFILVGCAAFSPSISALIVTFIFKGKKGIHELLKRAIKLNFKGYIYILTFGIVIFYMYIGAFTAVFLGATAPALWIMIPKRISTSFVSPLGEEVGWRGILTPGLQEHFSPIVSSAIIGIIWGLWHLWYFIIPGSLHISIPFAIFLLDVIGGSLWYTWLYNKSDGSVFSAILFHSVGNLFYNIIPYNPIYFKGSILPYTIGSCIMVISGMLLNWNTKYGDDNVRIGATKI